MNRTILLTGITLGLLAVILGAFGAHGLEKLVDKNAVETYEVGVRYQMYHALFLLFVGLMTGLADKAKKLVFYFVLLGVILFSGSIYLLAMNELTSFDFKVIGFLTPIGGLCMILGWVLVGYKLFKTI